MKGKFYIFAVAVIIVAMVFSGCKKDEPVAPTVATKVASEITTTSAKLKGEIINQGSAQITSCGFYYDTVQSMIYPIVIESNVSNTFTITLSELKPNTKYYYRAYARNNAGLAEGDILEFTTAEAVPPSVVTASASAISQTGATINGNVQAEGSDPVSDRGFMFLQI